jgi:hypothetical protein
MHKSFNVNAGATYSNHCVLNGDSNYKSRMVSCSSVDHAVCAEQWASGNKLGARTQALQALEQAAGDESVTCG